MPESSYHLLVVDDDMLARTVACDTLHEVGIETTECVNGFEALDVLRVRRFDAVLLDRHMPGLSGDEVCRRIRGELGEAMLPILMLTGDSASSDLASALEAGATDFIRKPFDPVELHARVRAAVEHKRITDQLDNAETMLFALARMVEAKDENTGDHCSRLAHNAVMFGRALGLSETEQHALRRGGVLHDIGKLGIPDAILMKPGKLTDDEWKVMRQHTLIGARLCSPLKSMALTVPIIRSHHERWDGSGYPEGLAGEAIPLLARVFQLVDIYDALAYARPYKAALPQVEVLRILREEGDRQWRDPALLKVFLDLVARDPASFSSAAPEAGDLGREVFDDIAVLGRGGV
ncbi:response regulator [Niveibacterium umoris]|uniref:Putative two-component system response regulator n=1 Tax=Niveibacterium umoris TaxID=1193620 RepID=A0A840BM48_9RHOO|nr:HD domain-containing phosphohydrolase [Niveibacterium umoris]MBB4013713.1 putative two-component system response regulator [Niveibacterium umoris]